jgi:putative transcription factor
MCEVCGSKILGKPFDATIEGARLTVCRKCSALGTRLTTRTTVGSMQSKRRSKTRTSPIRLPKRSTHRSPPSLEPTLELVKGFGKLIREAREAAGLDHEELGRRLNEKTSVLKKLEAQKMRPDNKLAQKLQYTLKIKLLEPIRPVEVTQGSKPTPLQLSGLTLEDYVKRTKDTGKADT